MDILIIPHNIVGIIFLAKMSIICYTFRDYKVESMHKYFCWWIYGTNGGKQRKSMEHLTPRNTRSLVDKLKIKDKR